MTDPGGATDPEATTDPHRGWGLGDAAVGYVVGFIVSGLAAGLWAASSGGPATGLGATAAGVVGLWVGLAGSALLASRRKGTGSLRADFGLALRWWDAPIGAAVGLAAQVVLVPLLYLPVRLLDPGVQSELGKPARALTNQAHGAGVAVLVLVVVLGAPVVEELFFRGLLLRSLRGRFGPVAGVAGSAVLFALAHFELVQLLALAAFGVVLALLALRTGRLGPGIFAHMAFNAVTVAVLVTYR
ncbi:MAG TPA: type II CAAX endopeptidase family protein [Acidimicrobiales bacterium]|nr:type II CAAX endopeptidase family protein [Acidimicrobiales bacterium]